MYARLTSGDGCLCIGGNAESLSHPFESPTGSVSEVEASAPFIPRSVQSDRKKFENQITERCETQKSKK
jgi:hypothetical protein